MTVFAKVLAAGIASITVNLATASDDCFAANLITHGTSTGDTSDATNDGSASCGDSDESPDVWFQYPAFESGVVRVDTCGTSWDTVLSVHSGCPGTAANELACNDDACGVQSIIEFPVTAGTSYLIRVAGFQGASGPFTLTVTPVVGVEGDNCADATEIGDGAWAGDTSQATNDGDASCGNSSSSPDVWFSYTAAQDGLVEVKTCGTTWDTVVSVHTGCPGTAANELACNDDACAVQSRVLVMVEAGQTYLIRVAGFQGATGPFTLSVQPFVTGEGADVFIAELTDMVQYGRVGDIVGVSVGSPVCNAGDEPLDWFPLDQPNHPFINANLYRLRGDRVEQIGQSWIKHGFAAAQANACGLGCIPHPDSTRLGVGCSDTYGSATNANPGFLGPRHEVNPWTGFWSYKGSHLQQAGDIHSPISHRLQLHDQDLDTTGEYFVELYVVAHDDGNHLNSIAWEPVTISGAPGGTWTFNLGGSGTVIGPAIMAWPGATISIIPDDPVDDGRVYVAAKAIDNGDGTWRYEYAIYNHDLDRAVGSFSVPLGRATTVSNTGFNAVESHDEPFSNDPWGATVDVDKVTWATEPFGQLPPNANPIRWGTLYNFWFDADTPPADTTVTLGLFKPGNPDSMTGSTVGPLVPRIPGDVNGDGVVGITDFLALLAAWGPCADCDDCPADFDGDCTVGVTDMLILLANWT